MRLIHTADWHLGRIFHGVHLTEDQALVLDQLVQLVKEARPDAVLVSGDIYDRAVPPPEAVTLLDDLLSRIVLRLGVPVIISAGNHDSPHRLGFGNQLLRRQGLHVVGVLPRRLEELRVTLEDRHGPVQIYALPFAEPLVVRARLLGAQAQEHETGPGVPGEPPTPPTAQLTLDLPAPEPGRVGGGGAGGAGDGEGDEDSEDEAAAGAIRTHDAAMRALAAQVRSLHPRGQRSVLMAHAFVEGGRTCDSERPISFSSQGLVNAAHLQGFDYVAMGHLHCPQRISAAIHYAGSPLKYSFAEIEDTKSALLVELDERGRARIEPTPLTPRRDVRRVEGRLAEVLAGPAPGESREDYVLVTLTDREPLLDATGRLQEVYPNLLHIERPLLGATNGLEQLPGVASALSRRGLDEHELFATFYHQVTGEPLGAEHQQVFASVVSDLRRREREVS